MICRLHDDETDRFRFLLLTQHSSLQGIDPRSAANPVEIIQKAVDEAMQAGEIPDGDPALVTAALMGVVLQAATFRMYGRIDRTMVECALELTDLCLKVVS
jgi:hypothetical protein